MTTQPKHGDRRNYRKISTTTTTEFKTIDTNQPFAVQNTSFFTGEDHWCEICQEWVAPTGLFSAILCPKCDAPWDKRYWETPDAPKAEGECWE